MAKAQAVSKFFVLLRTPQQLRAIPHCGRTLAPDFGESLGYGVIGISQRLSASLPEKLAGEVCGLESGIALFLTLAIMVSLSALALSMFLLTDSQIRLGTTMESRTQVYYAAMAGLEEARGRLTGSAPDALTTLPQHTTDVLYIVNSSAQDPVNPTDTSSPYYDSEYVQEFPGGLTAANVLSFVSSDQPGAGTNSGIPYKWVRITLKTEYASHQDVNQDGVLDSSTPVYWDGSQQDLSTNLSNGVPVYKLTAFAMGHDHIQKTAQTEVAAALGNLNMSAALETAGSASLNGIQVSGGGSTSSVPNLTVDGTDSCGISSAYGVMSSSSLATSGEALLNGLPAPVVQNASSLPQSATTLLNSLRPYASPVMQADSTHVALSTDGTSYVGSSVAFGVPAIHPGPSQPTIAYADKPLFISGASNQGAGILLVQGNLSITDTFTYKGLIVVNGTVTLTSTTLGGILIDGALLSSGNVIANSSATASSSITVRYDSCAISDSSQILPHLSLASRELSY